MVTKVLLVEDDPYNRQALTTYLRVMGLEVEQAHDGFEALRKVDNSRFDVVVSDIKMPGLDGVDLVKLIRSKLEGMPIVLISGDPTAAPAKAIADAQVLRVFTKPFSPSELLETISRVVSDKEL